MQVPNEPGKCFYGLSSPRPPPQPHEISRPKNPNGCGCLPKLFGEI